MPTYEYECSACGHRFEEFQSIKAKPTVVCPQCKKRKVKRLISAGAGFIFKGSGFYETDYRSDGYRAAAKADVTVAPVATGEKGAAAPVKSESSKGGETPVAAPAAKPAATEKSESKGSGKKK